MTQTHTLLAIHAEDGVTEFEAPGKTPQQAVKSKKADEMRNRLAEEYGDDADCTIVPANISSNHPVIDRIEDSMPDLKLQAIIQDRTPT